jgi:hypothetical protein
MKNLQKFGEYEIFYTDGTKATIELNMDTQAIIRTLGQKAVRSKGSRARYLGGLIVVKHLKGA